MAGMELLQADKLSSSGKMKSKRLKYGRNTAATEVVKSEAERMTEPAFNPSLSRDMPKSGFETEESSAARDVTAAADAAESPIPVRFAAEWLKRARFTALAINKPIAAYKTERSRIS